MKAALDPRSKRPFSDPLYLFPDSKNPYFLKINERREEIPLDNFAETLAGGWRKHFDVTDSAPLHVEIGCNGGHVLLEWAAKNPQALYLGLDWKFKQVFLGHEKALKRNINNAHFIRSHASRLPFLFQEGEVDELYIFFPDPWPRKSQFKFRFLTQAWFEAAHRILKPGGKLWFKTDHDGYFEWVEEEWAKLSCSWQSIEKTRDLHAGHADPTSLKIPDVTLFERLWIKDGIKIKSLKAVK